MKKTIVIIILAVYVASIAVVNFFGLEVKQFEGNTYVSSILCETVTFHGDNSKTLYPVDYAPDGTPLFFFDFIPASPDAPYTAEEESINSNPNVIQLNYEALPHLADNTKIKFEYDETRGDAVFHELSSSFVFLRPDKLVTITLRSTDGSNKSFKIMIMGRSPQS